MLPLHADGQAFSAKLPLAGPTPQKGIGNRAFAQGNPGFQTKINHFSTDNGIMM
jgi:hypothetical protein